MNTLELGSYEGSPIIFETNGGYILMQNQKTKEWIEKDISFFDDEVNILTKDKFIESFGTEIITEFNELIEQIEHENDDMIGGSSKDNDSLKGDVLKGLL